MTENASQETLGKLAADPEVDIRWAVATNATTNQELLQQLGKDKDPTVRQGVLRNPSTTDAMVAQLATDSDPQVALAGIVGKFEESAALKYVEGGIVP